MLAGKLVVGGGRSDRFTWRSFELPRAVCVLQSASRAAKPTLAQEPGATQGLMDGQPATQRTQGQL